MIKRPALSLGITAIFLAGFIPWYLYSDIEPRSSTDSTSSKNQTHTSSIQPNIQHDQQVHKVIQEDSFNTQLAQELIDKYGDKIDHLAVQANLFKVRNFILERYPEDGMERFSDIINLAFPNQAESILKIVGLMNQYTQWLAENYIQLNDMSPLERDGHLWKKRRELFGHDADIIWSDERDLLAQKQRNVQQEIHRLGEANELSNDEKLYQLTTTLSENYGEAAQDMVIDPGMVAAVFFNFDSVQQSLEDLPAEERQVEINKVREQLGYNEEQIKEAQKKDEQRNQRWKKGLTYMAERQQLVDTLEGDALTVELENLRQTHFKHEAYTIAQEETSGFYRYARPRVYGRN